MATDADSLTRTATLIAAAGGVSVTTAAKWLRAVPTLTHANVACCERAAAKLGIDPARFREPSEPAKAAS